MAERARGWEHPPETPLLLRGREVRSLPLIQRSLRWQHPIKVPAHYGKRRDIFPITPEPLATRLAQASTSPAQFAERLADFEQSGGKFLYAVRVLNDLASPNGALRPDCLDDLPRGMEGFHLDAFRHRFPAGEDIEPMRALLGVLCAQREPQVQRLLARIEDFLRITNRLFAFDHLSLVRTVSAGHRTAPEGWRLASGSRDATIKLWDPTSRKPGSSQLLFVAGAAITALAFLPGVWILVAGDASGRLHWLRLPGP
jgi:hypothetical protein